MTIDRRALLGIAAGAAALPAGKAFAGAPQDAAGRIPAGLPGPDETLPLWPAPPPRAAGAEIAEQVTERSADPRFTDRAIVHVARPRLDVFRPARPNGAAVLIMPGGAYQRVVIDKEGYELGRWLAARGVTAFALFYRLPGDPWAAGAEAPLADAQRAMRLIRHGAARWGVDARRVAAMGFSAGGHLCASLATRWAAPAYAALDAADGADARPMLAACIYPVIRMAGPAVHAGSRDELIGKDAPAERAAAYSPDLLVTPATPPCFLLHAEDDDALPPENSLTLHAALRAAGVSAEMHLFEQGGHGFGLAKVADKPAAVWPELFLRWAQSHGLC